MARSVRVVLRLLVAGVACALALAAAEVCARVWLAPDMHWFQPVFRHDELVGYTLKPGEHGVVLGAKLRANERGFRGGEWRQEKAPGGLRIALLGDSHAFGYGVEEDAALAAVLAREVERRRGAPVEVLNFALPGYSARQSLAVLEHQALGFAPDVVVLVLCDNDERADLWADDAGWLRGGVRGEADAGRADGAFLVSRRWGLVQHSRLLGYLKLQALRAGMRRSVAAPGWNQGVGAGAFGEVLREEVYSPVRALIAKCRARGVRVVLALFGVEMEYRRLLATLAEEEGVPALDLVTLFPECDGWNELVLRFGLGWDPHLGAAGHARWGEGLGRVVAEALLVGK